MIENLVFKSLKAPGDILMLQLAIRELHLNYPDKFKTDIISGYPEITYNNPYLTKLISNGFVVPESNVIDIGYDYELNNCSSTGHHFSDGYISDINYKLGLKVIKGSIYPEVYLTDEEKDKEIILKKYNLPEKFWIINAGIKIDMPLKSWLLDYWKSVIGRLVFNGVTVVQVGSNADIHPRFEEFENINGNRFINLVGKTECLREFIKVYNCCIGSIGPISLHMHLAAAFKKPCIIIAGGREEPTWEQYPNHVFFSTVGLLNCCKERACRFKQRNQCLNMIDYNGAVYPKCMFMIEPNYIVNSVLNYEE
jgi:ADP-heptose:LPS heptosyltransferase